MANKKYKREAFLTKNQFYNWYFKNVEFHLLNIKENILKIYLDFNSSIVNFDLE